MKSKLKSHKELGEWLAKPAKSKELRGIKHKSARMESQSKKRISEAKKRERMIPKKKDW